MKKKLLFIVEAMGGGVFTYIVDLANELSREYVVYVAYGTRKQTPKDFKRYFNGDVKLIEVKNFTRSINFRRDISAFWEIKKIYRDINPDMVHVHSSKAGVLGRLAFSKKTPVFYTPHGYSFLMSGIRKDKRFIYKLIEKVCSLRGSITIACSQGEYNEALKISKRVELVNNGINIITLDRYRNDVRKTVDVVTLGRITYQKNPELFNEVAKKMPYLKFRWIGDGELRNQLTAKNIEITGWLLRREALQAIQESKIFMLGSRWEGLPLALLEAMYLEKVCVVSDVVGNHDVIENKKNGFICTTVEDYVEVLKNIISNKENEDILIQNARNDILEKYNTKTMADNYHFIYEKYSK